MRVSTDKQDYTTQRDNLIRSLPDGAIYKLYVDEDVSSSVEWTKRKGLQQLLRDVQPDDQVVCVKLDRMARDVIEMVLIHRAIANKKATMYSLAEGEVPEWLISIHGAFAQKEKEDISARIRNTLKEKKLRGERVGRIPYGFQLEDEGLLRTERNRKIPIYLVQNPEEQAILTLIASYRDQGVSFWELPDVLNCQGILNRGNPWTRSAVYRVHSNNLKRSLEQNLQRNLSAIHQHSYSS